MSGAGLIILFIGLAIVIRLIAGSMDKDRIGDYVRSRGGRLLSKEWAPFGRGWAGEKDSRIYIVTYEDSAGQVHRATCKTSSFSGVYFTDDEVVGGSGPSRVQRQRTPGGVAAVAPGDDANMDVAARLRRLDRLRAEDLISPVEHAEQRRRILERL